MFVDLWISRLPGGTNGKVREPYQLLRIRLFRVCVWESHPYELWSRIILPFRSSSFGCDAKCRKNGAHMDESLFEIYITPFRCYKSAHWPLSLSISITTYYYLSVFPSCNPVEPLAQTTRTYNIPLGNTYNQNIYMMIKSSPGAFFPFPGAFRDNKKKIESRTRVFK